MISEMIEAAEEVANDEHLSGQKIDRLLVALKVIKELSTDEIRQLDKIAECLQWSKEAEILVKKFSYALNEKIFNGR